MWHFYPDRPNRISADFVKSEYEKIFQKAIQVEASEDPEAWTSVIHEWNALTATLTGEFNRLYYRFNQNMRDTEVEAQFKAFQTEIKPQHEQGDFRFAQLLLESKKKASIDATQGDYFLKRFKVARTALEPVNSELRVQIRALENEYGKLKASGVVTVDGREITLPIAASLQASENPGIRKQAFQGYRQWFLDHHQELSKLFSELVRLRHQMARNLGFENFIQLGYAGMNRTDYGPEESRAFRENIKKHAVPLQTELHRQQAAHLGTASLQSWDSGYDPQLELPMGVAPIPTQLDQAQKVFERLSPVLAKHFTRMRKDGLIDLENRPGKGNGAFCISYPDEKRTVIFCNSTGQASDVSTLMHEMGHAFQGWESFAIILESLQNPTYDAAELHSMGMEYLSIPYMDEFFSPTQVQRYRKKRWKEAIELLCYIAVVDEFQHWLYENPEVGAAERDREWVRIWDVYKPSLDFTGFESHKFARWYAQGHIFTSPFYYIDYGIAEMGAMQLAKLDHENHAEALEKYLKLCRLGGTRSVLGIFQSVQMRSPFDSNSMKDLMKYALTQVGVSSL